VQKITNRRHGFEILDSKSQVLLQTPAVYILSTPLFRKE